MAEVQFCLWCWAGLLRSKGFLALALKNRRKIRISKEDAYVLRNRSVTDAHLLAKSSSVLGPRASEDRMEPEKLFSLGSTHKITIWAGF